MNSILLTGGGFANKGAEALLKTVKAELIKRLEHVRFQAIVPANQVKEARKAGFVHCNRRNSREFLTYHLGRVSGLKAAPAKAAASQAGRYRNWLKECTAVIDVSGYVYTDKYETYSIQLTEKLISSCSTASVPYMFLPQAWGPLSMSNSQLSVRLMAEYADIIYARDKTSFRCLQSIPDIPQQKLKLAPDIVLKFEPHENHEALDPLERTGLFYRKGRRIGICPNIRIYRMTEREGTGTANPYVRWLVQLCKEILAETDAELILFGHEISRCWWRRDDRYLCQMVRQSIGEEQRIRYFSQPCSADTLKLLIRELDFLVGSRFHSLIAALSLYVPSIAMGWSHKYKELLKDAGIGELAFSYEQMYNRAIITDILEAWANREQVRCRLERSIPLLRQKVDEVFDQVAKILRRVECC